LYLYCSIFVLFLVSMPAISFAQQADLPAGASAEVINAQIEEDMLPNI